MTVQKDDVTAAEGSLRPISTGGSQRSEWVNGSFHGLVPSITSFFPRNILTLTFLRKNTGSYTGNLYAVTEMSHFK